MSLREICALPVDRLAADEAHLWLWVTSDAFEQIQVMAAWGFAYRSCLTWIKPRFGLGNYLRNQTEHLLLRGTRTAPVPFKGPPHCRSTAVSRRSSIERCSPGPYLELCARRKRCGSGSWGNQGGVRYQRRGLG